MFCEISGHTKADWVPFTLYEKRWLAIPISVVWFLSCPVSTIRNTSVPKALSIVWIQLKQGFRAAWVISLADDLLSQSLAHNFLEKFYS